MTKQNKQSAEAAVRDIRRRTRRKFSPEEKIRIVLKGLRGEQSVSDLCRIDDLVGQTHSRSPCPRTPARRALAVAALRLRGPAYAGRPSAGHRRHLLPEPSGRDHRLPRTGASRIRHHAGNPRSPDPPAHLPDTQPRDPGGWRIGKISSVFCTTDTRLSDN